MNIEQLLELANDALREGNNAAALEFYQVAQCKDPNNKEVLELYGDTMVHTANTPEEVERAKKILLYTVEKCNQYNDTTNYAYISILNLAQLSTDHEALHYYQQAVQLIEPQITKNHYNTTNIPQEYKETLLILINVYSSIAELYLTDLCFETNAPNLCQEAINRGIRHSIINKAVDANIISGTIDTYAYLYSIDLLNQQVSLWISLEYDIHTIKPCLKLIVKLLEVLPEDQQPELNVKVNSIKLCMEVGLFDYSTKIALLLLSIYPSELQLYLLLAESLSCKANQLKSSVSTPDNESLANSNQWILNLFTQALRILIYLMHQIKDINSATNSSISGGKGVILNDIEIGIQKLRTYINQDHIFYSLCKSENIDISSLIESVEIASDSE